MRTRITGRFVIGYDGADHVVYRDGEVVYEHDRVLFVGHGFEGRVDAEIAAGDAVVGPGFVDLERWPTSTTRSSTPGSRPTWRRGWPGRRSTSGTGAATCSAARRRRSSAATPWRNCS
jgi:cytosine/adenosine deaminase-related metal-dependent hydrolase